MTVNGMKNDGYLCHCLGAMHMRRRGRGNLGLQWLNGSMNT